MSIPRGGPAPGGSRRGGQAAASLLRTTPGSPSTAWSLGELDRAHTHAITARAAADAAENLLRAALAEELADQA